MTRRLDPHGPASRSRSARRQLGAGADVELGVDVAQVVLHRLRAQEERRRCLTGRAAVGEKQADLQLAGGQLDDRSGRPSLSGLTGGPQLGERGVRPALGAEPLEVVERCPQLHRARRPAAGSGAGARRTPAGCGPARSGPASHPCQASASRKRLLGSGIVPASIARTRAARASDQGWPLLSARVRYGGATSRARSPRPPTDQGLDQLRHRRQVRVEHAVAAQHPLAGRRTLRPPRRRLPRRDPARRRRSAPRR